VISKQLLKFRGQECLVVVLGIKTKTCGAKSGLKIGSLNPKTDLWQI
jgi:hypothetical protein